jgi:hypothetical protein
VHNQAVLVEQAGQDRLVGGIVHQDGAVRGHEPALFAVRLRGRRARQPQDAPLLGHVGFEAWLVRALQGVALIKVELVVRVVGLGFA